MDPTTTNTLSNSNSDSAAAAAAAAVDMITDNSSSADASTATTAATAAEGDGGLRFPTRNITGIAPIKTQYIIKKPERPPTEADSSSSKAAGDEVSEPPAKKQKVRGQNKKREFHREVDANKVCIATAVGKVCQFGDSCMYSHDIELYKKSKPEDLDGLCIFVEKKGSCPFGIMCRFSKSHPENMPLWDLPMQYDERNFLSKPLQKSLRGNKYSFKNSPGKDAGKSKPEEAEGKEADSTETSKVDDDAAVKQTEEGKTKNSVEEEPQPSELETEKKENLDKSKAEKIEYKPALDEKDIDASDVMIKLRPQEKKKLDFRNKLYLAPLTTVGNLPFRRICKNLGADITCGEMAMATNILQGQVSEWALLRKHVSEDFFGVQIAGCNPMVMGRAAELISNECEVDFIDINMGCPIDLVFRQGSGSALLGRVNKVCAMVKNIVNNIDVPLTTKMRTGVDENHVTVDQLVPRFASLGVSAMTIHGRSKRQHYYHFANWDIVRSCAALTDVPMFGNGDILSYSDYEKNVENSKLSGAMLARGALIKPWLFTEIKERRDWDISSKERFELLKDFCRFGLEHWGSDSQGISNTRRFLLEWQSFLYRYIPIGLLEVLPQKMNERPPPFYGRDELETLMASPNSADWVKLSEMLLGKAPPDFKFIPKHKANSVSEEPQG